VDKLSREYDLKASWNGDRVDVTRSGANGSVHIFDDSIRVELKLGMMLSMMAPSRARSSGRWTKPWPEAFLLLPLPVGAGLPRDSDCRGCLIAGQPAPTIPARTNPASPHLRVRILIIPPTFTLKPY
jgi:hypothetical protein